MRYVFVESNFILELAFRQEEATACEKIIGAAEAREIMLAVPTYCLTEVFQTLGYRRQERQRAEDFLQKEIKQHLREQGAVDAEIKQLSTALRELLISRTATQTSALFGLASRLTQLAYIIPLAAEVLRAAPRAQQQHSLTAQDALVYASVRQGLAGLGPAEHLFVSRNKNDFQKEALLAELRELNCSYMSSFQAVAGKLGL